MKVYILEDEIVQQFRLESLVKTYLKEKKYPITEVITYDKSRDFLAIIAQLSQNNLYFLDIAMRKHHNAGLKIAEKIRQKDMIGQISFVTTHSEFASITYEYKVNAHDFIDKLMPQADFDQKIKDNIDHFVGVNRLKPLDEIFSYRSRTGKVIEALYSDIYYFETTGVSHKILLQMDGETLTMYGNMNEIATLSDRFVRVHRSYLVNKSCIKRVYKKEKLILLDDDTEIAVSRGGFKLLERLGVTG